MRSLYAQFNSHNNAIMAPVGTIRTVFAISKSVRHMLSQIYSCCHCYLLRRRPATCISTHTYIHVMGASQGCRCLRPPQPIVIYGETTAPDMNLLMNFLLAIYVVYVGVSIQSYAGGGTQSLKYWRPPINQKPPFNYYYTYIFGEAHQQRRGKNGAQKSN